MIGPLSTVILLPLVFALIVPFLPSGQDNKPVHTFAAAASVLLFLYSCWQFWLPGANPPAEMMPWLPSLGISYALGTDGLSSAMVVLTTLLLLMAVVASFSNIQKRVKLYYSMVFVLIASVLGVFLARDAFLFFLFWELELIPMYLLIAIWGGPRRDYAAMKFVLYTLFGSVFMVAALLWLYFHARTIGLDPSTLFLFSSLGQSVAVALPMTAQVLIFLGLFIAFGVKLPMVPFHTWLPDAHVEAPTPISMLLAGILLKMGAYGMLQICFGLLPEAARLLAPYIALLAVINILYTAAVALVQKDMKKLIAYSSVSHMGFVLLGLAALNATGFSGAVFVMFSHGIVSAALFMCVGTLYTRTHTRMIADYGGMGAQVPTIFYFFLFMGMASIGLPLLISFAGESLVMYGAFIAESVQSIDMGILGVLPWTMQTLTILAAIGIIIGAAYTLWMLQRVFFGEMPEKWNTLKDASLSEVYVLGSLAVLVIFFGLCPASLTEVYSPAVDKLAAKFELPSQIAIDTPEAVNALAIEVLNDLETPAEVTGVIR
nr:NADH-quinone oxidoreductase subunit M [Vampirovibrio sp.]